MIKDSFCQQENRQKALETDLYKEKRRATKKQKANRHLKEQIRQYQMNLPQDIHYQDTKNDGKEAVIESNPCESIFDVYEPKSARI